MGKKQSEMSDKKQSSIEWVIKKIQNRQNGIFDGLPHLSLDEILEQGKAMYDEEMKEMYLKGIKNYDPKFWRTRQ